MKLNFVDASGRTHQVEVSPGINAMEAAIRNGVPGIDGDCGGNAACGTCHVIVDQAWLGHLGSSRSDHEVSMLEVLDGVHENSRLACQIVLSEEHDGMSLHLPASQF